MVALDIAIIAAALAVGLAFPHWWLVVPSMVFMALGLFGLVPGGGGLTYAPLFLGLGIAARRAATRLRAGRMLEPPTPTVAVGVGLFVALTAVNVYAIENTARVNSSFWGWCDTALTVIALVGGGLLVARWWAVLLLPLLAVLIAVPAGENHAIAGDIPWVAFLYVFLFPLWAGLVALGVAARKLAGRRRVPRRRPRPA